MTDYIVASPKACNMLRDAEYQVIHASTLLEDVVEPSFECCRCDGILADYARETGGDLDKAARNWMEENYDRVYAVIQACTFLVAEARGNLDIVCCAVEGNDQIAGLLNPQEGIARTR